MKKKKITQAERLQIIGLTELANQASKRIEQCRQAVIAIVGVHDQFGGAGHLEEIVFDDVPDVDKALENMEITVEEKKK